MGTKADPLYTLTWDQTLGTLAPRHCGTASTPTDTAAPLLRAVCRRGPSSSETQELYLKLLFLPGLFSNLRLSRGNLSAPMSNIFSASWKKGGSIIVRSKGNFSPCDQKQVLAQLKLDYTNKAC